MTAPIGHGIKLYAMREFHPLPALELEELTLRSVSAPLLLTCRVLVYGSGLGQSELLKLYGGRRGVGRAHMSSQVTFEPLLQAGRGG